MAASWLASKQASSQASSQSGRQASEAGAERRANERGTLLSVCGVELCADCLLLPAAVSVVMVVVIVSCME